MGCVPDGQTSVYLTLARYRILDARLVADTVLASSEVVTVAEEEGHPKHPSMFIAKRRVQVDTLHWKLVRVGTSERWGVCGYPAEGYGFGQYGDDANTEWTPRGANWRNVHRLADSIHSAP
jgi:hypothetical protein